MKPMDNNLSIEEIYNLINEALKEPEDAITVYDDGVGLLVVFLVDYGEGEEWLIEGNLWKSGETIPCFPCNYSCERNDFEKFREVYIAAKEELLNMEMRGDV